MEHLTPNLRTLLLQCGALTSNTEFKRYIKDGAIKVQVGELIDDKIYLSWEKITDENYTPILTDLIKCGKHKTYECRLAYDHEEAPTTLVSCSM